MELALSFNQIQFDIVDRENRPWLRLYQIGSALGYEKPEVSVSQLYTRHADEFTASMTALVKLPSEGGEQETRIFSLRGCHLLAMLARTPVAKAFRKWVLDVLDKLAAAEEAQNTSTDSAGPDSPIGPADQNTLQAIVRAKVAQIPEASNRGGFPQIWSRFNNHFRLGSYKQLPQSKMAEAVEYLVKLEVRADKALSPKTEALPSSGDKYEAYTVEVEAARVRIAEEVSRLMDKGIELVDYRRFGPGCLSPFTYALAAWLRDALTRPSSLMGGWRNTDNALNHSPVGIFQKMEKDFEYLNGK